MSVEFEPDTIKVEGLHRFLKVLKQKPPEARLGILGGKAARKLGDNGKTSPTNATIGAVHEYGSIAKGIPQRSFLRVPVADRLQKAMQKAGAFTKEAAAQVLKDRSVIPWLKTVAEIAREVVRGGFDSGGYGKWQKWRTPGYESNTGQILVDTQQLRDSIDYDVKETK